MALTEAELPYWANESFFEMSLKSDYKKVKVVKFTLKMATAKGDNYLSEMYRACVDFTTSDSKLTENVSLIIKCLPEGGASEKMIQDMAVYPKEICMYSTTVPIMENILRQNGINVQLCGKTYYMSEKKPACLVIEDLALPGFKMANRKCGLDLAHCELTIKKLGVWHAASMAMVKKNPEAVVKYDYGLFNTKSDSDMITAIFVDGFVHLINAVESWPGCEKYVSKLKEIKPNLIERTLAACKMNENDLNVLNHNDLWVNNMLFKYNGQKPSDVIFVDFQLTYWTSLGIDLNYFMFTSPTPEVRRKNHNDLIGLYHRSLAKTLLSLNYTPIPSLQDVQKEMDKRVFYGFFAATCILPLIVHESNEGANMESLLEGSDASIQMKNKMFKGRMYEKAMRDLLPYFESKGVFD